MTCSLPLCKLPAVATLHDRTGQPFAFCTMHAQTYARTATTPGYTAKAR